MIFLNFVRRNYGLILVLLLSFWAIRPFFIPGFFPMHDDTQVARVFEMGKMLGSGVFPVRWVPDLGYGYGYPIFNFYAPLAYYVGGLFILLGFDALIATKLMMILGIILAGVFMYLLTKEFFGELGGLVSGLFYLYAPYHAVDIYVRGDAAEFWAYAFIPLMILGLYKRSILIGSIGFAGVILSHNLTALMVTPFLLIAILLNCYIVPKGKKLLILYHSSLILFLGLAVSAFYWIPALLEIKNTNVFSQIGGGADFRDHFVCIQQLWTSNWGFGGSTKSCIDGLSLMIGKLHIFSVFSSIFILIYLKFKHKNFNDLPAGKAGIYYLSIFAILGFIISIFLMLEVSRFIWQAISLMAFFQYPWRFLLLTSFFSSLLSGFVVWFLQSEKPGLSTYFKPGLYISVVFISLLLFLSLKFFVPQTIFPATAKDLTSERALKWVASKTSDEFLPPDFEKPKSEHEIAKNPIPFKETTLEKASNTVSLIGALALIIGIISRYGKNKR